MVRIPGFKTLSTLFLLGLALASTSLQAPAPNLAIGDLGRLPETVESGFKNVVIPVAHKISTKVKSIFHVKNLVDATAKSGEKKYEYGKGEPPERLLKEYGPDYFAMTGGDM